MFRSERYVLSYDNREMRRIMCSALHDFVEIPTNSETYGGGGIYVQHGCANSDWAGYLFVHACHYLYYTSSVAYKRETIIEPYEPNVTALLDPGNLKWKHYVDDDTSLPTEWPKDAYEHSLAYQEQRRKMREENVPEARMNELFLKNQEIVEAYSPGPRIGRIGAFEGANYQAKGYYRSELNCIMFTRNTSAGCAGRDRTRHRRVHAPLVNRAPSRRRAAPRPGPHAARLGPGDRASQRASGLAGESSAVRVGSACSSSQAARTRRIDALRSAFRSARDDAIADQERRRTWYPSAVSSRVRRSRCGSGSRTGVRSAADTNQRIEWRQQRRAFDASRLASAT